MLLNLCRLKNKSLCHKDDLLHEADEEELRDLFEEEEIPVSAPSAAQASLEIPVSAPSAAQASLPELVVPLTPSKVVAAMQPTRTSASLQGSTLTAPMPPTSVAHGVGLLAASREPQLLPWQQTESCSKAVDVIF